MFCAVLSFSLMGTDLDAFALAHWIAAHELPAGKDGRRGLLGMSSRRAGGPAAEQKRDEGVSDAEYVNVEEKN